jgi:hypothetical protein
MKIPETDDYLATAKSMWGAIGKPAPESEGFLTSCWAEQCMPFLSYRFPNGLPGKGIADTIILELGGKSTPMNPVEGFNEGWYIANEPPFNMELLDLDLQMIKYYRGVIEQESPFFDMNLPPADFLCDWLVRHSFIHFLTGDTGVGEWGATWGDNRVQMNSFPKGYRPINYSPTMDALVAKSEQCGRGHVLHLLRSHFVTDLRPSEGPDPPPPPDPPRVRGSRVSALLGYLRRCTIS